MSGVATRLKHLRTAIVKTGSATSVKLVVVSFKNPIASGVIVMMSSNYASKCTSMVWDGEGLNE